MSLGCPIVASDTPPVAEVIKDTENGYLFDFFSPSALAAAVHKILSDDGARIALSKAARDFVVKNYDLQQVCLPKQVRWVEELAAHR